MWYIYISIAVLFRGAFCYPARPFRNPAKQIEQDSNCTVVITRFNEQVTTLEVKWNSDIHMVCNASCVGPGPQPGLTWFYIDKKKSKRIRIERQFRSKKFKTVTTNFHRYNELDIYDFGPNEETDFICEGSTAKQRVEAKVTLTGTDCPLKYNFRCKLDNKCIDRSYLCNKNKECLDGEDEIGCEPVVRCIGDQFQCADGDCVMARMKCDGIQQCEDGSDEQNCPTEPPKSVEIDPKQLDVFEGEKVMLVCSYSGFPPELRSNWSRDGQSLPVSTTIDRRENTLIIPEAKAEDSGDYVCTVDNYQASTRVVVTRIVTAAPPAVCTADQYKCDNGECVDDRYRCDGKPDCYDRSDENNCQMPIICTEGRKACNDFSACISDSQICDKKRDCLDGSDEKDCDQSTELQTSTSHLKDGKSYVTKGTEPQTSLASQQKEDGNYDVTEGNGPQTSIASKQKEDGEYDVTEGTEPQTSLASQQKEDGNYDVTEGNGPQTSIITSQQKEDGEYDVTEEKTKTLMLHIGINVDEDNDIISTTDGVADNTAKYTDNTPFEYEFYS